MCTRKLILCVDDEATGLIVRKLLLETEGHAVLTAENGPSALALFSSQAVDLVVLDFAMPGMDGGMVAEKMKTLKPAVPIVMLSAYLDLPAETVAKVDKLLTKGEPPRLFLRTITELLRLATASSSA
jgi:CheY-like chemotaxis protein